MGLGEHPQSKRTSEIEDFRTLQTEGKEDSVPRYPFKETGMDPNLAQADPATFSKGTAIVQKCGSLLPNPCPGSAHSLPVIPE